MDEQELKNILDKHFKWLRGENGGKRANLFGANLSRADLSGADLSGANLSRADLSRADYIEKAKNLFYPIACPEIGAFVGWKKARVKTSGHECIVKLEITEDAVFRNRPEVPLLKGNRFGDSGFRGDCIGAGRRQ